MLTTKIKYEHLKSFTNHGDSDRPAPRLRHADAAKPEPRNCLQEYLTQDHKPKIVFDSRFAGMAAYELNDSGFVVPELDPEIDGKNKCRYCGAEFLGRKRCRNHMWSKHKQQIINSLKETDNG